MRRNVLLALLFLLAGAVDDAAADTMTFVRATANAIDASRVVVYVTTAGQDPPAGLTVACFWTVSVESGGAVRVFSNRELGGQCSTVGIIRGVEFNSVTEQVELTLDRTRLTGIEPRKAQWNVAFTSAQALVVTPPQDGDGGRLIVADAKDDADLYASGGFTGANDSAPIWTLDAKGQIGWPTGKSYHWFGLTGEFALNPDPNPPQDTANMNPNAMALHAQMDRTWANSDGWFGYQGLVKAGGEFAADPQAANATIVGQLSLFSRAFFGKSVVVDPFLGYEFGTNLSKPDELFGRPVDLKEYDTIARTLYGGTVKWYMFQPTITADQPYRFVASVSWTGRALGTKEPYVKSEFGVNDKGETERQQVLTLTDGFRNYFEAGLAWNVTRLFGAELKYKRGSKPPLFQFVDGQVSVQLTFKAKFTAREVRPQ